MGYLTTITIYNDHFNILKSHPDTLVEDIEIFMNKGTRRFDYAIADTKVHKARHSDDPTIYIHIGNNVIDLDTSNEELQRILKDFPKYYDEIISFMEWKLNQLKSLQPRDRKE